MNNRRNKSRRLTIPVIALLLMSLTLSAMAQPVRPLIGVIQIVEHAALDASRQGFIDALKENGMEDGTNYTLDYRNAQGSPDILASIADHFVAEQADMVLAIATPSAQTMAGKTETIPILGTAITDYVDARLAKSNEVPGYNVTGTSDMSPIKEQLELILKFQPEAKTIGLLYTASEDNSVLQAKIAREIIEGMGLAYTEITVHNSNDVQQATQAMVEQCDAIYIPTDNVFASAMPVVYEVAVSAGMPIYCGDSNMVREGGVATLAIDYYDLGYQTGLMALEVFKGADVSVMPIQTQKEFSYTINKAMADAIGLEIPAEYQQYVVEGGE